LGDSAHRDVECSCERERETRETGMAIICNKMKSEMVFCFVKVFFLNKIHHKENFLTPVSSEREVVKAEKLVGLV
jgi:hypothetical protein